MQECLDAEMKYMTDNRAWNDGGLLVGRVQRQRGKSTLGRRSVIPDPRLRISVPNVEHALRETIERQDNGPVMSTELIRRRWVVKINDRLKWTLR